MNRSVRGSGLVGAAVLAASLCAGCAQSDAGITTEVQAKLDAQRDIPSGAIQVNTAHHVVTLTGTVSSQTEKQKAVQLARNTEGVKDVVDNLAVQPGAAPAPPAAPSSPAPPANP